MRFTIILLTSLLVTGCAAATDLTLAGMQMLVDTDPNRHVSTVVVGRDRYTVTTHTSADGRKSTVRVR